MRVKHFRDTRVRDYRGVLTGGKTLDGNINYFLQNNNVKVIDIKYSADSCEGKMDYSALVLYEEKLDD